MHDENKHWIKKVPIAIYVAFGLYFALFGWAAWIYPGGSDAFPDAAHYDWFHNYWCDLMGKESKNCQPNIGHFLAKIAHVVSAVILILFSIIFPFLFEKRKSIHKVITWSGILMGISFALILTELHDIAINFTGLFGGVLFVLAAYAILTSGMRSVFWSFLLVVAISSLSFLVYTFKWNIYYLPFLQKIMLLSITTWIIWVSWKIKVQVQGSSSKSNTST